MKQVRIGLVTVWIPERFARISQVKPARKTRQNVNAGIQQKADTLGVEVRKDPRQGKDADRIDLGKSHVEWRKCLIDSRSLVEAMRQGYVYARYIETEERGGRHERKVQIHQVGPDSTPEGDGILKDHELKDLLEGLSEGSVSLRNLWINPGEEGLWANVVVGPGDDATSEEKVPVQFLHDGSQVVVEIPD